MRADVRFPPIADISVSPLPSAMKRAFSLHTVVLLSCTSRSDAACPTIHNVAQRDADADARAALARGDHYLLMLGGFVGTVPGVENPGSYPTQVMEGTSDIETETCARQGATAESYVTKYNQTIVRATGR